MCAYRGMKLRLDGAVRVPAYGPVTGIRGRRENATWAGRYSSMGVRARAYRWPPLPLTRLRFERVSVGVVGPRFSRHVVVDERRDGESDRVGRAPRFL